MVCIKGPLKALDKVALFRESCNMSAYHVFPDTDEQRAVQRVL